MASIGRQVSLRCSKLAVPALCYVAFPPCTERQQDGRSISDDDDDGQSATRLRPIGICRDDCQRLVNDACKTEYDSAPRMTMRFGTTATTYSYYC